MLAAVKMTGVPGAEPVGPGRVVRRQGDQRQEASNGNGSWRLLALKIPSSSPLSFCFPNYNK